MTDTKDPESPLPTAPGPTVRLAPLLSQISKNPAEWMHERIVRSINDFENELDQDHEVGARLVSFGSTISFHIADVGYWGPDIITFYGVDEQGQAVQLIQHTNQLSVLLIAVKKQQQKARRIGFTLVQAIDSRKDDA